MFPLPVAYPTCPISFIAHLALLISPALAQDDLQEAKAKVNYCSQQPSACGSYIAIGVVLIAAGLYLWYRHRRHKKERAKKAKEEALEKQHTQAMDKALEHAKTEDQANHLETLLGAMFRIGKK